MNCDTASDLYYQRYMERRQPDKRLFSKLENNLKKYGYFAKPKNSKIKFNEEDEVRVFAYINYKPTASTRETSQECNVSPEKPHLSAKKKEKKWKLNIKLQSKRKKSPRKKKRDVNVPSSDGELLRRKPISFGSIEQLKPLQVQTALKYDELVKSDPKFLNKIPYVLINMSPLSKEGSSPDKCENVNTREGINKRTRRQNIKKNSENNAHNARNSKNTKVISKSVRQNNELYRYGIVKHLIVNVFRMQLEKNKKETVELEKLDLQLLNLSGELLKQTDKDISEINNSTFNDNLNSTSEKPDSNSETKNKRKSVSFAEEKNVEIEYFQDASNLKIKNFSSLDRGQVEGVRKQNKGILKYEEKQNIVESGDENEEEQFSSEETEVPDLTKNDKCGSAINKFNETGDDVEDVISNEFADSDNESLFNKLVAGSVAAEGADREKNENDGKEKTDYSKEEKLKENDNYEDHENEVLDCQKELSPENKGKPVSIEDISDDENTAVEANPVTAGDTKKNDNISENHGTEEFEKSEAESMPNRICMNIEDISDDETSNISSDNKLNKSKTSVCEQFANKSSAAEENVTTLRINISEDEVIPPQNRTEENVVKKKYKPRPLSKQRMQKLENVGKEEHTSIDLKTNEHTTKPAEIEINDAEDVSPEDNIQINHTENIEEETHDEPPVKEKSNCPAEDVNTSLTSTNLLNLRDEVFNKNKTVNNRKEDKGNDTNLKESNKSVPENEITKLTCKYINQDDESSSVLPNIQAKENMLKAATNDTLDNNTKDMEKELGVSTVVSTDSLSGPEQDEDFGISEQDNENISSILSEDLGKDKLFETSDGKSENDLCDEVNHGVKRKAEDELNTSKEKKRKKVTFCEDVA